MCKNMDFFCVCVVLGFFGLVWLGAGGRAAGGGSGFGFFLILFLKCAFHISVKTAAHINEAAWVL